MFAIDDPSVSYFLSVQLVTESELNCRGEWGTKECSPRGFDSDLSFGCEGVDWKGCRSSGSGLDVAMPS